MLDSMHALPSAVGMPILGEYPLFDRLERGIGLGLGLEPPPILPLPPRVWRPNTWGSQSIPCPLPPPGLSLPLCPEPCHLPALTGVGMSHLFDYMASARLWYPWYYKGDSVFSSCSALDNYELASKDLPTRSLKQERLKDRQDLAQALSFDKERAAKVHAKKSAGTQTQFSSFNGDAPAYSVPPPPSYFAPRGDLHPGDIYSAAHHGYVPPPQLPPVSHASSLSSSAALSPTSNHLIDLSHPRVGVDIQNVPLNLSLSTNPSSGHQPRPSVIACASALSPSSNGSSSPHVSHNGHGSHGMSCGNSPPVSDPAIEEHFRRSLGKNYGDSISKTMTVSASTVQANVSITGTVDDHFAKALGDSTWKAIKSQNDPSLDVFTGSVDDHFAKALGATTWRRIKAETEITESANLTSNSGTSTTAPGASSHTGSSISAPVAT